jgi:predicted acyltransferase (DUF342 family)
MANVKKRVNSSQSDNSRNKLRKRGDSSMSNNSRNILSDRSEKRKKINQNMKKLLKYKMAKIADNSSNEGVSKERVANNMDLKSLETTLEHKLKSIRSPVKIMIN